MTEEFPSKIESVTAPAKRTLRPQKFPRTSKTPGWASTFSPSKFPHYLFKEGWCRNGPQNLLEKLRPQSATTDHMPSTRSNTGKAGLGEHLFALNS